MDRNGQPKRTSRGRTCGSKNLQQGEVRHALLASRGLISSAARRLGVVRQSIYNALERWPELREIVEEERELHLDEAETALFKAVKRGEAWAICFMLKTQGKARGYTQRQEVLEVGSPSLPPKKPINWKLLPVEERIVLLGLL